MSPRRPQDAQRSHRRAPEELQEAPNEPQEAPGRPKGAPGGARRPKRIPIPTPTGRARARSARARAQPRLSTLAGLRLGIRLLLLRCCSSRCSCSRSSSSPLLLLLLRRLQCLGLSRLSRFPFHDSQVSVLSQKARHLQCFRHFQPKTRVLALLWGWKNTFSFESAAKITKKTAFGHVKYRVSPVSKRLKPRVLRRISCDFKRKTQPTRRKRGFSHLEI